MDCLFEQHKFFQKIKVAELPVDLHRLFPPAFLKHSVEGMQSEAMCRAFEECGLLSPPVLYRDENRTLHVIDGMKRLQWLGQQHNIDDFNAIVLSSDTPAYRIALLTLASCFNKVIATAVSRACFCSFLHSRGIDEKVMKEYFMPAIGMSGHSQVVARCLRIASMPDDVLAFCHEKGFSFKKCLNFSRHDNNILADVMKLRNHLSLSASILEEILCALSDISRMQDVDYRKILASVDVIDLLQAELSISEKTSAFRNILREMRYPVLKDAQRRISSIIKQMHLPSNVSIDYDRTLENRKITITVSASHRSDLEHGLAALSNSESLDRMAEALKEL